MASGWRWDCKDQASALSSSLLATVMNRLTDEIRQESQWMIMFPDDNMIHSKSREQVERRGMKVGCSKSEHVSE